MLSPSQTLPSLNQHPHDSSSPHATARCCSVTRTNRLLPHSNFQDTGANHCCAINWEENDNTSTASATVIVILVPLGHCSKPSTSTTAADHRGVGFNLSNTRTLNFQPCLQKKVMLISARTYTIPKQLTRCSESPTKVIENILSILNGLLIKLFCTVTVALSLKHGKGHKGQYCFTCFNYHCAWCEQIGMWGHRGVRGRTNSFFAFQIRVVVVVLPWALPLRSGCLGILRNNGLRSFASFSNQLQLNAKTSTVSAYLSNIHPPNKSRKCCYPYFT